MLVDITPEKCGTCMGKGRIAADVEGEWGIDDCSVCHGSGKVYPAELVRIISMEFAAALAPYRAGMLAGVFVELCNNHAVAVLDALNGISE